MIVRESGMRSNSASQAPRGVKGIDTGKDPGSLGYARDDTMRGTQKDLANPRAHFAPGSIIEE
jgi:hypothetical protein